jgi:hypothetical protein
MANPKANPEGYRARAAEITELVKTTTHPGELQELQKRERSLTEMADNEQWVADNHDKTLHAPPRPPITGGTLAAAEEHVLRCLGAAVITQWNALPTELQRDLFDNAGATAALEDVDALRGLIARFLHKHKNSDDRTAFTPPRPGMGAAS